jgi:hypothetical protein
MRPERFAEEALRAVARNRAIIVIPSWWRIVWWLNRLSPSLGLYLGRKSLGIARRAAERLHRDPSLQSSGSESSVPEGLGPSESSPEAGVER